MAIRESQMEPVNPADRRSRGVAGSGIGAELRATLALAAPLAALDIPLKVLVWEDRNGAVSVSYNSPGFLAGRHHLEGALRAPFDAVESIVEALVLQL